MLVHNRLTPKCLSFAGFPNALLEPIIFDSLVGQIIYTLGPEERHCGSKLQKNTQISFAKFYVNKPNLVV